MNVTQMCKHGLLAYNPRDAYVGKSLAEYGEYAEEEAKLFAEILKPGNLALDIGASIGVHTLVMANAVGPQGAVMAFEPQRQIYYTLCANVALNGLRHVYCFQHAVGMTVGSIPVPELDFMKPGNFGPLDLQKKYDGPATSSAKLTTIDSLNLPRLELIKADVEGMEIDVLQGARNTIQKHRPTLYLGCTRPDKSPLLVNILRLLKYNIYFHTPYLYNDKNFLRNDNNYFSNAATVNLFCFPEEKESPVEVTKYRMKLLKRTDTQFTALPDRQTVEETFREKMQSVVYELTQLASICADLRFDSDEAMKYLDTAIHMMPLEWRLHRMAAPILSKFMRYQDGLAYAEKAIELAGPLPMLVFDKAVMLDGCGWLEEANECYREVLKEEPDNVEAHCNLAFNLLTMEQYEEGWKEIEWRFKIKNPALQSFMNSLRKIPHWDGSPLDGRRILLYIEQGVGDQIQFVRYLPYVTGGYKLLGCFKNVAQLFKNCVGYDEMIAYDDEEFIPPDLQYDTMASIMSLPYLLKMNNVPDGGQYLWPQKEDLFDMSGVEGLKVGITWSGHAIHKRDHIRSCYLRNFKQLQLPGVRLFSLQKGDQERIWPNKGPVNLREGSEGIDLIDWSDRFRDFNATANLIQQLDLVITVDTSIAHLAGALGKPVWLLINRNFPDWRWLTKGTETPWYKSMRIFRGTWDEIFPEVTRNLQRLVVDLN